MDWTAGMLVAIAGFMTGQLLFGFLIRWVALVAAAWPGASATESDRPRWGRLLLTVVARSLFHSAPWLVAAVAFFAYHVHSEAWAEWLFWGAGASMLFMAPVTITVARRIFKRRGQGNVA